MKICLVGGIFGRPEAVRSKQLATPETVLLDRFRKAGVDVHPVGHAGFQPSDDFDIIHVHHFGRAAVKMASSKCRGRFVFTGHDGQIITGWERSWLRRYAFQYVVDKAAPAGPQTRDRNAKAAAHPRGSFAALEPRLSLRRVSRGRLRSWRGEAKALESISRALSGETDPLM